MVYGLGIFMSTKFMVLNLRIVVQDRLRYNESHSKMLMSLEKVNETCHLPIYAMEVENA